MSIYSPDTGDFIGTATYSDNGAHHVRATACTGRYRSFDYQTDAVKWLTRQYNRTH